MKKVVLGVAALSFAVIAMPSFAESEMTCSIEPVPAVPAKFESAKQKEEVKKSVLGFISSSNEYRECLEAKERMLGEEITPEQEAEIVTAINSNVDDQEAIAAKYNAAAKIWAEENPE